MLKSMGCSTWARRSPQARDGAHFIWISAFRWPVTWYLAKTARTGSAIAMRFGRNLMRGLVGLAFDVCSRTNLHGMDA